MVESANLTWQILGAKTLIFSEARTDSANDTPFHVNQWTLYLEFKNIIFFIVTYFAFAPTYEFYLWNSYAPTYWIGSRFRHRPLIFVATEECCSVLLLC